MTDYSELKRLAEAAAKWLWNPRIGLTLDEARFAERASPAAVLALIAENENARRTGAFWKDEKICADAVIDQLKAENEALRKDAERYRHIRQHSYVEVRCDSPRKNGWRPDLLDICVDAAMSQGGQSGV